MFKIRNATHSELRKYYKMMEVDFDKRELIGSLLLHKAVSDGTAEMIIGYDDESNIDIAYAYIFNKNVYNYVLLKYMGVFPWYRAKGIGNGFLGLLINRYKESSGIFVEIPEFEENEEQQLEGLRKLFKKNGFIPVNADYSIGGAEVYLMCKPLKIAAETDSVAHRIIPDFYTRIIPEEDIKICKKTNGGTNGSK